MEFSLLPYNKNGISSIGYGDRYCFFESIIMDEKHRIFREGDLKTVDPLLYEIMKGEGERQKEKLLLNAATSITPRSILEIQGSILDNIDAEGYIPRYIADQSLEELKDIDNSLALYKEYRDDRFNKCCEYVNIIEGLAIKRLAKAFESRKAPAEKIKVNVQVPTGALANEIVYEALLNGGDIILSLGTQEGGHTTHGDREHISYDRYKVINYHIDMNTGAFDFDEIGELLEKHKPRIMVAGASSYPLSIDWERLREEVDRHSPETLLMADIAHTAGLVAGGAFNNPLGIADITTMVGYKTFCGPRAAAIMTTGEELAKIIDETVFPRIMGSPLLLGIGGLAVAGGIAMTEEYKAMQKAIVENARTLCKELVERGLDVVYGKTDSHIVLLDCEGYGTGREMMDILEDCNILVNSVTVPSKGEYHDGLRLGTTAITQFGISQEGIKEIADIIAEVFQGKREKREVNYAELKERVSRVMEREME